MQTRNFSIFINAPREKVWHTMLDDATYRKWTVPFIEGSYFKGDWSEGSKMEFLGPHPETGKEAGMVSHVKESRPYEFISVAHYGEIADGVEAPWGEGKEVYENYTFIEKDGGTEVLVEMTHLPEEWAGMFDDAWPRALEVLKELAEKQ